MTNVRSCERAAVWVQLEYTKRAVHFVFRANRGRIEERSGGVAKRRLTRWHITRFGATAARGAYAYVQLHGKEQAGFKTLLVSETFHVPLDTTDEKAHPNKEILEAAKKLSTNQWVGSV